MLRRDLLCRLRNALDRRQRLLCNPPPSQNSRDEDDGKRDEKYCNQVLRKVIQGVEIRPHTQDQILSQKCSDPHAVIPESAVTKS